MNRKEIIEKIINLQKNKPSVFVKVAKRSDLEKLTLSELNLIYNISYLVEPAN